MRYCLALLLTTCLISVVDAWAEDQICSGSSSWVRDTTYDQMNIPKYSPITDRCQLTIEPQTDTYLPNQLYTLTVTPSNNLGIKVVALGGAEFISTSTGGVITEPYCVDYHRKYASVNMTFKTPAVGKEITLKALCGTKRYMYVSDNLVLNPGVGVTAPQLIRSTDPEYSFQQVLHKDVILKYSKNATHLDIAVDYNQYGYVSFGVGSRMVPSLVLIGVNPEFNAAMPPVALYRLINEDTIGGNILVPGDLMELAGISEVSFAELANGHSVLRFTQSIAQASSMFNLVAGDHDEPIADMSWAVGPRKYGMHTQCGTSLKFELATGIGGKGDYATPQPTPSLAPTSLAPSMPTTRAPTENNGGVKGGTASDDRNFKFMKVLNSQMKLYYKKNATHGTIKLTKSMGGYLSFGVGKRMVPSFAITGMDITLNPEYKSMFAVYDVLNMDGDMTAYASTPQEMFDKYGLQETYFTSTTASSELGFSVLLEKQSPDFYLFRDSENANAPQVNIVYAGGPKNGKYEMHPYGAALLNVDFASGNIAATELPHSMMTHIVTMTLGWGVFIPLAVIIRLTKAKCGLRYDTWLQLHTVFACLGMFCSLVGFGSGLYYVAFKNGNHFYDSHGQLGLVIFIVAFTQPLLGFGRHLMRRRNFTMFHVVCGFALIFLAEINNLTGISSLEFAVGTTYSWNGEEAYSGFAGALGTGVTCVTLIFFFPTALVLKRRVKAWYMNRYGGGEEEEEVEGISYGGMDAVNEHNAGKMNPAMASAEPAAVPAGEDENGMVDISLLNTNNKEEEEEEERIFTYREVEANDNLTVFNGDVYDFTEYLDDHPGGGDLITEAGKDITAAYNEQGHSKKAMKVLKKFYVGKLERGSGGGLALQ